MFLRLFWVPVDTEPEDDTNKTALIIRDLNLACHAIYADIDIGKCHCRFLKFIRTYVRIASVGGSIACVCTGIAVSGLVNAAAASGWGGRTSAASAGTFASRSLRFRLPDADAPPPPEPPLLLPLPPLADPPPAEPEPLPESESPELSPLPSSAKVLSV